MKQKNKQQISKEQSSKGGKIPFQQYSDITYSVRLSNGIVATNPNDIERLTEYSKGYY